LKLIHSPELVRGQEAVLVLVLVQLASDYCHTGQNQDLDLALRMEIPRRQEA
jgi:hypothetical protein